MRNNRATVCRRGHGDLHGRRRDRRLGPVRKSVRLRVRQPRALGSAGPSADVHRAAAQDGRNARGAGRADVREVRRAVHVPAAGRGVGHVRAAPFPRHGRDRRQRRHAHVRRARARGVRDRRLRAGQPAGRLFRQLPVQTVLGRESRARLPRGRGECVCVWGGVRHRPAESPGFPKAVSYDGNDEIGSCPVPVTFSESEHRPVSSKMFDPSSSNFICFNIVFYFMTTPTKT